MKKIEIAWSELSKADEKLILEAIDEHWVELNKLIDQVFAGKKIQIKRINNQTMKHSMDMVFSIQPHRVS